MTIFRSRSATIRYRVVIVNHFSEPDESTGYRGSVFGSCREFKTLRAAQRFRQDKLSEGHTVMLQFGIVRWMNEEDASKEIDGLNKAGVSWE